LTAAILFGVFAVLPIIGVPVTFALTAASIGAVIYLGLPTFVAVQQLAARASLTTLIATPLFIFDGETTMGGGISGRGRHRADTAADRRSHHHRRAHGAPSRLRDRAVLRFSSRFESVYRGAAGFVAGGCHLRRYPRGSLYGPIESASIAVGYAVRVTAIVYRNLTVRNFVEACRGAVRTTPAIGKISVGDVLPSGRSISLCSRSCSSSHSFRRCRCGCRRCCGPRPRPTLPLVPPA
jgi:hypothetical protein